MNLGVVVVNFDLEEIGSHVDEHEVGEVTLNSLFSNSYLINLRGVSVVES